MPAGLDWHLDRSVIHSDLPLGISQKNHLQFGWNLLESFGRPETGETDAACPFPTRPSESFFFWRFHFDICLLEGEGKSKKGCCTLYCTGFYFPFGFFFMLRKTRTVSFLLKQKWNFWFLIPPHSLFFWLADYDDPLFVELLLCFSTADKFRPEIRGRSVMGVWICIGPTHPGCSSLSLTESRLGVCKDIAFFAF